MATAEARPIALDEPTPVRMTVEEFLTLPDDGIDRDIIDGIVREYGMTTRSREHGLIQGLIWTQLNNWLSTRPEPRGEVVGGESGFQLKPGTIVGIDVAYASPELCARSPIEARFYEGPPALAVEVLSPSDTLKRVDAKVDTYLAAGVAHVWIVHPKSRSVMVYRPETNARTFHVDETIDAEPDLPGFRAQVAQFFRG